MQLGIEYGDLAYKSISSKHSPLSLTRLSFSLLPLPLPLWVSGSMAQSGKGFPFFGGQQILNLVEQQQQQQPRHIAHAATQVVWFD